MAHPLHTAKEHFERRRGALELERSSFISHWKECAEYIAPRRGRFERTDRNRGEKQNKKIVNSVGSMALKTLSSGMMAGITSPARPWFRLSTHDRSKMEASEVRIWLSDVEALMREIFASSNLYEVLPILYRELGLFGTSAMSVVEDFDDVIRCYHHPVGEYSIGINDRYDVDTFYRVIDMSVGQIVQRWGLDAVSSDTMQLWKEGNVDAWRPIVHCIEANDDRNLMLTDSKNKAYRSVYYEMGKTHASATGELLSEQGFDEFPVMVPRWELTGGDIYGTDCPGMTALGDIRALQIEEKRKAQAIDKLASPPLKGPSSLRNIPVNSLPGGLTLYDNDQAREGLQPIYQVNPRIQELMADIQQVEHRINRAFYADLFLMIANSDRRQVTAREIDAKQEEKLLGLGPVLERVNNSLLDPLISRTFAIMARADILPPIPDALQDMPLKVEYISIMAMAQRAIGTGAIERTSMFVSQLAQADPSVVDKIDLDQAIDEYTSMVGVDPRIVRDDEVVAEIRAQRQQMQQMQQMAEMAKTASEAGRNMSQTPITNEAEGAERNALQGAMGLE